MNKMPDAAMTLAVVALYADGLTANRDVASWRVKETERMIAICIELIKIKKSQPKANEDWSECAKKVLCGDNKRSNTNMDVFVNNMDVKDQQEHCYLEMACEFDFQNVVHECVGCDNCSQNSVYIGLGEQFLNHVS